MLETPRLIMRPYEESDAEAAHVWLSDAQLFRFYTYGPYRTLSETAQRIREYRQQYGRHGFGKWAAVERATGVLIGDAGLVLAEKTGEIHVGYRFARSHWGKGLATEAAKAWVDHGFEQLNLDRVAAFIHPENAASIRVAEKLGFTLCRHDREHGIDWKIYELFRNR